MVVGGVVVEGKKRTTEVTVEREIQCNQKRKKSTPLLLSSLLLHCDIT
jgi:hypothetical protein